MTAQITDWLLFLGAGASVAPPTRMPLFKALATGVLRSTGWSPATQDGREIWIHPVFPPLGDLDVSAEVLFGGLRRFGFEFAEELARLFQSPAPNAVHVVASQVLAAGGCVWTTNVDEAIEEAHAASGRAPKVFGGGAERSGGVLQPIGAAGPGTLLKLHGTARAPASMALTDLELIAPLERDAIGRLASLADGRNLILYGYAGADADLADLLDEVLTRARCVLWFEPILGARAEIAQAFRNGDCIDFRPVLPFGAESDFVGCAAEFLRCAVDSGVTLEGGLRADLLRGDPPPPPPSFVLETPPGIAQARLVERFGRTADQALAIWVARCDDARHRRWGTLPHHVRWAITRSLYHAGVVADLVRWAADHRLLLRLTRPRRLRDYIITRACALLLQTGDWRALGDFADWAVRLNRGTGQMPHPSDLYYRSQAFRYDLQPHRSRSDADTAIDGLSATRDPERLAGALYESGCAAIYQGRFEEAERRAFELRFRRGRYAIPRWRGWGAWLQTIALCHLDRPDDAAVAIREVWQRFEADGQPSLLWDARTADLLVRRLQLAHGEDIDPAILVEADSWELHRRYRDDRDLILADIEIALDNLAGARPRLERILNEPSAPVARVCAELGMAEILRREGSAEASDAFMALLDYARPRQATWIQVQAVVGLALCADPRTDAAWQGVRAELPANRRPEDPLDLSVGNPRMLWLLTI